MHLEIFLTLKILKKKLLNICVQNHSKSGKKFMIGRSLMRWHIADAYVINKKNKKKIIDFKKIIFNVFKRMSQH